jgi:WD40 repeat protein
LDCDYEVLSLSISPGGTTLVSVSADNVVRLWDMAKHKCTQILYMGYKDTVGATFSPDGSRAALRWKESVGIWSSNTGEIEAILEGKRRYASSVTFSHDGSFVASGYGDGSISISEASSGRLLSRLSKHTKEVSSVVFSADGRRLFSSSADTTIREWSLFDGALFSTPKLLFTWGLRHQQQRKEDREGHSTSVLSVAFSPDERWLVSISGSTSGFRSVEPEVEPEVLVWDTKSGKCATKLRAFALRLTPLSFHPNSTSPTFACGFNQHVYLWDSQTWKKTTKLRGHTARVNCVQFTHDRCTLLSSSEDRTIKLWDSTSKNNTHMLSLDKLVSWRRGYRLHQVIKVDNPVAFFPPFPNDTRMAAISGRNVFLWDIHHTKSYYRGLDLSHSDSELTCTSSDQGDVVYVTVVSALSATPVLVWNSNSLLLGSDRRLEWKHVRAKHYPNIADKSGWVLHTKDARIPPQTLAWIPSDRRNQYLGASATSQSGRLFAIGGHSGLITILDLSAMVEHLAADVANKTEAVPQRDGQLEDVPDHLSVLCDKELVYIENVS